MFKVVQMGKEHSDGTVPFLVKLDKVYTVREFIDRVLDRRPNEWGHIGIKDDCNSFFGEPHCEYRLGKLETNLPEEFLDRVIHAASGDGGYSLMNYLLELE